MDRLGVGDFCGADDRRDVEIALRRGRGPDANRLISKTNVLGIGIGFRMHDDRLDSQLATGALDAKSDLAPVGDQHLVEELPRRFVGHYGGERTVLRRMERAAR
jgi:hypothetical protein